jgi:hypothetical protein
MGMIRSNKGIEQCPFVDPTSLERGSINRDFIKAQVKETASVSI